MNYEPMIDDSIPVIFLPIRFEHQVLPITGRVCQLLADMVGKNMEVRSKDVTAPSDAV